MQELVDWVNASAANQLYFQKQLDKWNAVHQDSKSLFDKERAFRQFKSRVNKVSQLKNPIKSDLDPQKTVRKPLPSNRKPPFGRRRQFYYKMASYAAVLCILAGVLYFFQRDRISLLPDSQQAHTAYIQIEVPAGAREKYILPDQTVVWLNAGSSFKYPATFDGETREVLLNGEGYFQVAKDVHHPFIVKTAKGSITVTGTTFNVNSYDTKTRFETALLEGHVHVNSTDGQIVNLLPSQKAELKDGNLNVTPITEPDKYRWMEGLICFENEKITEVFKNLENSFGEKITIKHLNEPDLLLTGKFRISDGLAYALKVLRDSYGITYETDSTGKGYSIIN